MKRQSFALLLALYGALLGCQFSAYAQNPGAQAEAVQNIGSANWRIGSRYNSTAIYIEAPANLAPGGVEWKGVGLFSSKCSAQNEFVRVEMVRGSLANFDNLKNAVFERVGGTVQAAKNLNIAGYEGLQLENAGKMALIIKYGADVWAVALLPQTAPDSKKAALKSAMSLWFERREALDWKDRAVGSTSFQADLPFELEPRPSDNADTVVKSARWGNFWVEATELRSGRTDLDGTVRVQIEGLKNQKGIESVRVKQLERRYGWGFLETGERGHFVQIDYTEGGQARRIYKIFSFAGTRTVILNLTLNANDPVHLHTAHRILGTARLGWTDSRDFRPQTVAQDNFQIESDSPFKLLTAGTMNTYRGTDPLSLLFVIQTNKPPMPELSEIDLDAQALVKIGVKASVTAAGGELTKSRIEPLTGTIFPARRVVFEAEIKGQRLNGDTAMIFAARKIVMPLRLNQSASTDFARRWATTFRGDTQTASKWPKRVFGGIELVAPANAELSADRRELSASGDGVKFKIKTAPQNYEGAPNFNPSPTETSAVTDKEIEAAFGINSWQSERAVRESARSAGALKVDAPTQPIFAGSAFGVAGWYTTNDTKFSRLDILSLHDGLNSWTMELSWNPNDPTSNQTRDAILNSIRSS